MKISDLLQETYFSIIMNKARSSLTILGIVIGIGSVIAMVSIGQGAQSSIESSIQNIGSNLILVTPGAQRGLGTQISSGRGSAQTLKLDDANAIESDVALVKAVAPDVSQRYQITTKGLNTNTQVVGTVPEYADVRNIQVDQGTFITEQSVKGIARVAVIAPTTRDDLFGTGVDPIGKIIKINQMNFTIVGLTKAKGGSGFSNQDDMIFIPISSAQRYLANSTNVSTISVQAQNQSDLSTVQQDITDLLLKRHKIKDPTQADFSTMNQADIVATASSVTGTFTILLGAIAGISLVVGGIGIMNMMLTNVTERTREIGLRKAIGAKRNDISSQFLAEAVALTFFGGVFGIMLGWLISLGVTRFASIATTISANSIFLAFGVSAGIGIVFGYYPARRAAKLNPIEALRYE
jgi:putative ABC transport system permease protein